MAVKDIPLFPTALMGSLPRSKETLCASRAFRHGDLERSGFERLIVQETEKAVRMQEEAGIDVITSGELGRDNYVSFVADKLDGVQMKNMSELLDYIEDKKAFEKILSTLDVPSVSIRNAICVGKLGDQGDIVLSELLMVKKFTSKPVKITLPGPYLLTRSMWLPKLSGLAYKNKEELGEDVIAVLKAEIGRLQEAGVDVIQFDEPVLTEVVFTEGKPRTFMCAALSEKKDPVAELAFAAGLIRAALDTVDRKKSIASLHVCRGNWSTDESILLSGPYTPLLDTFAAVNADLLTLEFSTPRAGDLASLLTDRRISDHTSLGLGVINPRTDAVENAGSIVSRAEEALQWVPAERLWLNPDCGFATFGNRPVNTMETIGHKLKALVDAAKILRARHVQYETDEVY
jgi:5-methyltetrahydropteroyltriglutamate--homocysteine methyltransferase